MAGPVKDISHLLALVGTEDVAPEVARGNAPEGSGEPDAIVLVLAGNNCHVEYQHPQLEREWLKNLALLAARESSATGSSCREVTTSIGPRHVVAVSLLGAAMPITIVCLAKLSNDLVSCRDSHKLEHWLLGCLVCGLQRDRGKSTILRTRVEHLLREHDALRDSHTQALSDAIQEREQRLSEQHEHMRQLQAVHLQNQMILNTAGEGICGIDRDGRLMFVNPAAARMLGWSVEEMIGKTHCEAFHCICVPNRQSEDEASFVHLVLNDHTRRISGSTDFHRQHGDVLPVDYTCVAIVENERAVGAVLTFRDVTEQRMLEAQLRQAQKLESIGQLAAGIAHEINTPTQYLGDNTRFLADIFEDLSELLAICETVSRKVADDAEVGAELLRLAEVVEEADIAYALEEVPKAISQSMEGVQQVARIVRSMKEFSHPGSDEPQAIDLNRSIESTLTVSRNEWKYVADVVADLDPNLPMVLCMPGDINQVLLNLIVNAAHAISDRKDRSSGTKGMIRIATRQFAGYVEVCVGDTGTGIPEHVQPRIFDPFFTTKEVGRGTGQGLAIAHSIVTDKHGGQLSFETETGVGTTFYVRLPLDDSQGSRAAGQTGATAARQDSGPVVAELG